uniref:Cyclic nucleotide-binding domain-containing protein n=1 Tax=Meloidogyne incognita TaxID=6306 RepID=A0A914L985_MELIC
MMNLLMNNHFILQQKEKSSPLNFFQTTVGDFQSRILQEGDIFGDWALVSECKIPYTVRSVGYSLLFVLEREAMAVAFDEYPHSRRMQNLFVNNMNNVGKEKIL